MSKYHKIQTVWLRDPENRNKTLLAGQWANDQFEYLAGLQWEWTEKIDGMNARVSYENGRTRYDGKTDTAQLPAKLVATMQDIFDRNEEWLKLACQGGVTLYGEGYGLGIQKGGLYLLEACSFILFDVRIGEYWLRRADVNDIAQKLSILSVPVVGHGTLREGIETVRCGLSSFIAKEPRHAEGLVMRPVVELADRGGHRVITKIKHKDFPR